jgi:hypothetical protein
MSVIDLSFSKKGPAFLRDLFYCKSQLELSLNYKQIQSLPRITNEAIIQFSLNSILSEGQ